MRGGGKSSGGFCAASVRMLLIRLTKERGLALSESKAAADTDPIEKNFPEVWVEVSVLLRWS